MLRRKFVFSMLSSPCLFSPLAVAYAQTNAVGAYTDFLREQAMKDPEVKQHLDFMANAYNDIVARLNAQDKAIFEHAKRWTECTPTPPKNMMELVAQRYRVIYADQNLNQESKKLASYVTSGVYSLFVEGSTLTPYQYASLDTVVYWTCFVKEAMFAPFSKYKNIDISKISKITLSEYFEMWRATSKTADLLTMEYVKMNYHPCKIGETTVAPVFSQKLLITLNNDYNNHYLVQFNKDPLNKVRKNKPMDFWTYVSQATEYQNVTSPSIKIFLKKFSEEDIEKTKQAMCDYIQFKSSKINLPKKVEKYLNS